MHDKASELVKAVSASAQQLSDPDARAQPDWWRTAVIYQVYPRSFADSDGDGIGDLRGVTGRLDHLATLGVDAVWLSPFYPSPQNDGGYDVSNYTDVDPLFGTLDDFDALLNRAHLLGLRVIIDLVPNHSSSDHEWFQKALQASVGSRERARYHFRQGRGADGELPPNNWQSVFGGAAWTRVVDAQGKSGEWYLHLFDTSQPDLNWSNTEVLDAFDEVLRFWLTRGVDGFRIDVAHGLVKRDGLPDHTPEPSRRSLGGNDNTAPYWAEPEVHEIFRRWRAVLEPFGADRVLIGEAWVEPISELAQWVRADELHQTFNFAFLVTPWSAQRLKQVVEASVTAFGSVGAPSTWVFSNHDVVRQRTRFGTGSFIEPGAGIGLRSAVDVDEELGLRRSRAATAMMLALPGSAYLYQGEELGLPEVYVDDEERQDPTFRRTKGARYGRDGCRVPLPWDPDEPAFGFSKTGKSWLTQPASWRGLAAAGQWQDANSTLSFYQEALAARREFGLGSHAIEWISAPDDVLIFRVDSVTVYVNFSDGPLTLPAGEVLLSSGEIGREGTLAPDTTVWIREE